MSIGSRFVLFVGVMLAVVLLCPPTHLAEELDSLLGFPQSRHVEEVEEADQDMSLKTATVLRRIESKESAIHDLLQGRIAFLEAVSLFQEINNQPPNLKIRYSPFPGATPEERAARQVIQWARAQLQRSSPGSDLRQIERMERELEEWFCSTGGPSVRSHLP